MRNRELGSSLAEMPLNVHSRVNSLNVPHSLGQRLTEMGLVAGEDIEKIGVSFGNVIVMVGNTRYGLSKEGAYKITV